MRSEKIWGWTFQVREQQILRSQSGNMLGMCEDQKGSKCGWRGESGRERCRDTEAGEDLGFCGKCNRKSWVGGLWLWEDVLVRVFQRH